MQVDPRYFTLSPWETSPCRNGKADFPGVTKGVSCLWLRTQLPAPASYLLAVAVLLPRHAQSSPILACIPVICPVGDMALSQVIFTEKPATPAEQLAKSKPLP